MSHDVQIFVFAGEKSGDLHGENLIKALKQLSPQLKIAGVGGPRMRAQGMECVMPMEEFQVMGFIDVFLSLPKLLRQFRFIGQTILRLNPQVVLSIDYPGFNLRMARFLRKRGFQGKLCHFICPSVWAWGKKRIPFIAKYFDLLLTILPFEKKYFSGTEIDVQFVGHPLIQRLKEHPYQPLPISQEKKIIALFPGSREKELQRNLPIQLRACQRLQELHSDLFFAISISEERFRPLIMTILKREGIETDNRFSLFSPASTYDLMKSAHVAIATSGTVTLELALHNTPTVVTYAISPLDLIIARDILRIRLPYYCLVNIIVDQEVFPELFGPRFTEDALFLISERMISEDTDRKRCKNLCEALRHSLTENDASLEAAKQIFHIL
jgi:lipid-A-disaccharide synthase